MSKIKNEKSKFITSIGGQALIEGVMMRGPKKTAMAVRLPDKSVSVEELNVVYSRDKFPLLKLPIIRGVAGFIDSLLVGYKALNASAEKAGLDDGDEEPTKFDKWMERVFGDKLMNVVMIVGGILGVVLAVGLFFWLPTFLFNLFQNLTGPAIAPWRSLFEGLLKMVIFVLYIALCAYMPDIHRVFQYHGAEHKTIFCYESGQELTVENVRNHSRFHPRCGTSFMVIMILLGIFVGFFIPFTNPFLRTVVKLLCVPVIVGIGYELIKICGKYDNIVTRVISAPGIWMQRITTKEPEDDMIEVAIASINAVIPENGEDKIR